MFFEILFHVSQVYPCTSIPSFLGLAILAKEIETWKGLIDKLPSDEEQELFLSYRVYHSDNVFRLRVSGTRKVFNETNKAEEKCRNRKI